MIVDDLLEVLELNENILCQFVAQMSDSEITNRIKNYWTIYEHLEHLTLCQKMLLGRIKQFIEEDSPLIRTYTPENEKKSNVKKTVKNLLDEFCELRKKQIQLIKDAQSTVWGKQGTHESYKKYTCEILVRHIISHDYFHIYRMEELWIEKESYINELN
jgi:uncharacterized damage-inducible protein DinB